MKIFIKKLCTLLTFLFAPTLYMHAGFCSNTIVATKTGSVPIKKITPGEIVVSLNSDMKTDSYAIVLYTVKTTAPSVYAITTDTETICISGKQRLYDAQNDCWIYPPDIKKNTVLLAAHNKTIYVRSIEHYAIPTPMHQISLSSPHTYFVGRSQLLTHNFAFVIGIGFAFGGGIEFLGISIGVVIGAIGTLGLKLAKDRHSRFRVTPQINNSTPSGMPSGSPKRPKKNDAEDEDKKHPNGKYKDTEYHHRNSSGRKSPAPIDGQRALDNSLAVENSECRVAIEGDKFVVLEKTSRELYHGHVRTWKELSMKMQQSIQGAGLTNHRGKFIK